MYVPCNGPLGQFVCTVSIELHGFLECSWIFLNSIQIWSTFVGMRKKCIFVIVLINIDDLFYWRFFSYTDDWYYYWSCSYFVAYLILEKKNIVYRLYIPFSIEIYDFCVNLEGTSICSNIFRLLSVVSVWVYMYSFFSFKCYCIVLLVVLLRVSWKTIGCFFDISM